MKCEHCPVAEGRACLGKTEPFAFFCDWAVSDESHKIRHVSARSAVAEGKPLDPHPSVTYVDPADKLPVRETPLVTGATANPYRDLLCLIESCDYRGEPIGCGCGGQIATWHCGAGRGSFTSRPFEVSLGECLECLKATEPTPEPSS